MTPKQVSTTAKGIAAVRAVESERRREFRVCYDPFARAFTTTTMYLLTKWASAYGDHVSPGTRGFIVCRCRYFDDYLQRCLQGPLAQVVILGAGLDSRAYRAELQNTKIKFYEVDQPATQASKIKRVQRVLDRFPENLRFVPIDFNRESLEKLPEFGYSTTQATLFMWEGVTHYLSSEAVDSTLNWIRHNSCSGSHLIFDYVHLEALTVDKKRGDISRIQRYSRISGERLTFGIEKGAVERFLTDRGYSCIVNVEGKQLMDLYARGPNADLKVADTYAIVHADVGER